MACHTANLKQEFTSVNSDIKTNNSTLNLDKTYTFRHFYDTSTIFRLNLLSRTDQHQFIKIVTVYAEIETIRN